MTILAAQQAKIDAALEMMVRVNGASTLVSRRSVIEQRVAAGARVVTRKNGERVLMSLDGAFFDARNITKIGLDYAERITP